MTGEATAQMEGWQDQKLALARELHDMAQASDAPTLALRFAALSGLFRPENALAAAGLGDATDTLSMDRLATVARLSDACDTRLWRPDWIMRSAPRARIIEELADKVAETADWRRAQEPFDGPARQVVDALLGEGKFAPNAVKTALEDPALSGDTIRMLIRGITYALPLAPAKDWLNDLRAALSRSEAKDDPEAELLAGGIFGRDKEIADLSRGIADQWADDGARGLAMDYVGAMGGAGKSTLLAEVRRGSRLTCAVCVTLDFDRPGIEGGDPLGLSRDLARQVAELVGAPAGSLYAAIRASTAGQGARGQTDRTQTQLLLGEVAAVMRQQDLPMLLTLDTMESLTLHGDSAAGALLDWLRLLKQMLPRLAIVVAGRESMPSAFSGEAKPMPLPGLPDEAALKLLEALHVTGRAADDLVALAKGNPLVLRLGAKVAADAGNAFTTGGEISPEASAQMKAGQLYRLILSRIDSPELRAVAHPGLLLRQICARMLMEVIAPEIGLTPTRKQADDLLDRLKKHVWLVAEQGEWLSHRTELRLVLLDLQIAEDQNRARRIFAAAADWHAREKDDVLALYYRLQDMRWTKRAPRIEPSVAERFNRAMIDELPQAAQDLLAVARGERSSQFRAEQVDIGQPAPAPVQSAPGAPSARDARRKVADSGFSMGAADELRMFLERRNYAEATLIVSRASDFKLIDPASPNGAAVIEALWRLGDWTNARSLLAKRMRALGGLPATGWEEMRITPAFAELEPEQFRTTLRAQPDWARGIADFMRKQDPNSLPDWDVTGLLLRAEHAMELDGFGETVWAAWTGDPLSPEELARHYGQCLRQFARGQARPTLDHSPALQDLIGLLLPDPSHAQMLQNRLQSLRAGQTELLPLLAQATLGAINDDPSGAIGIAHAASFAIDHIDAEGALAPFVTALATLQPGTGVQHIALAARRRMAAAAGYWTYGDPPEGWRQPSTDWRTLLALSRYAGSVEATSARAQEELERWRSGYGTQANWRFVPMVKRATDLALATPLPLLGDEANDLAKIAQKLIHRGVPLLLAPPLAVLQRSKTPLTAQVASFRPAPDQPLPS
ncbi:MAG: ATP-binding protein [Sphingobium sp.]|nr:ATP-binding protein [Sphingobium sp.]